MFEIIVILSRYYFLFVICFFLWQSIKYLMCESGLVVADMQKAAGRQYASLFFLIIPAFFILAYRMGNDEVFLFSPIVLLTGAGIVLFFILIKLIVRRIYKYGCDIMWNAVLFLFGTGAITLQRLNPDLAIRQLIFCITGFTAAMFVPLSFKLVPKLLKLNILFLLVSVAMLGSLFFWGSEEFGAVNWIYIGSMSLQPSEFVKVLFVLFLAGLLGGSTTESKKFPFWRLAVACTGSAVVVIILTAQKDLGSALILFMTFLIIFYAAYGNELLFVLGFGAVGAASFFAYSYFTHVRTRIDVWLNPWADISGKGYQITQSLFAVSTYGLFGRGLTRGYSAAVPIVERDVIFAAICEEMGGLFGLVLIGVYAVIFICGVRTALKCDSSDKSLLSIGFTALLAVQTFIVLGGNINLIPMTGATLPFVSYGGTSVFISIVIIGFIQHEFSQNNRQVAADY